MHDAAAMKDQHGHTHNHSEGIMCHVLIWLEPGIDVMAARREISSTTSNGVEMCHAHFGLGEVDSICDIFARWTDPKGKETLLIGEWINKIRQLPAAGRGSPGWRPYVARTSTVTCWWP